MKYFCCLLLSSLLSVISFAQLPNLTANNVAIIGVKQLSDGLLFLLDNDSDVGVSLRKYNIKLEQEWETNIDLQKPRGYTFNKLQIEENEKYIYVLNHFDTSVFLYAVNAQNGSLICNNQALNISYPAEWDLIPFMPYRQELLLFKEAKGTMLGKRVDNCSLSDSKPISYIDSTQSNANYQFLDFHEDRAYFYCYKPSRNHGKLHLLLKYRNLNNGDSAQIEYELKLDHTSFTYNSVADKSLLSFKQIGEHFYAIGKLDHQFETEYPNTKVSDHVVGIWVAKFNKDLQLLYLSELPFQYFNSYVTNDMVGAAVIDISDNLLGGIYVNINELKEVLYGKKYVFSLDSLGKWNAFVGGQDIYNFFEYDGQGLRRTGKKKHVRLMNDDWGYYQSNFLHHLTYNPKTQSSIISNILYLSSQEFRDEGSKIYNYFKFEESIILVEYIDKKKGLINFYAF